MKRRLVGLMFIMMLFIQLVGCTMYSSKAGSKEEMIGTYELTVYKKKNENNEEIDYKAIISAKAYFTLDINGYGYYAYQDKDTTVKCSQVYSTFIVDDEDETKYKSIELSDGITHKYLWEQKPGCLAEPKMGFDKNYHTFSYTIPKQTKNLLLSHDVDYSYVSYTKISNNTDLTTINEKLGTSFSFTKPFELSNMSGFYYATFNDNTDHHNEDYGKYEYMIIDMDSYNNGNVDVYYSLVAAPGKTQVACSITLVETNGIYKYPQISILGKTYEGSGSYNKLATSFSRQVYSEPDDQGTKTQYYSDYFSHYLGTQTTIDNYIAEILANK